MKIELKLLNDRYHMEAVNEDGNAVSLDASTEIGGEGFGMRPMQMLLASLGGCSSIDVISILKKQKQKLRGFRVILTAEREQEKVPSLFTAIQAHFVISGSVEAEKLERALKLTFTKYCSVAKILEKTAKINYSYEIKNS